MEGLCATFFDVWRLATPVPYNNWNRMVRSIMDEEFVFVRYLVVGDNTTSQPISKKFY